MKYMNLYESNEAAIGKVLETPSVVCVEGSDDVMYAPMSAGSSVTIIEDTENDFITYEQTSEELVTVTIDGVEKTVNANKSFNQQNYSSLYNVNEGMNACAGDTPNEGGMYSTTSIEIYIDGTSTNVSPHYTFEEQGYSGIVGHENCGWQECDSSAYPNESGYYNHDHYYTSVPTVNVYIDGEQKEIINVTYENFSDQGYTTIFKLGEYENFGQSSIDCPEEGSKWTTSFITIKVDDIEHKVSPYYTFDEQGIENIAGYVSGCWIDASSSDCPSADCEYYTLQEAEVTIDGSSVTVNIKKTWNENGYGTLYTTDYYTNPNESSSDYSIDTENYPSGGDCYYTNCDYQADEFTVTIDGREETVDGNATWAQNGYSSSIYDVSNSMSECSCDLDCPTSGNKYSTEVISVQIDGEMVTLSPYYTFDEQGYTTIYGKDNCGEDTMNSSSDMPLENWNYYTTEPMITVSIDREDVELSPYQTFSEQGYTKIWKGDDYEECANEKPQTGVEYWTT